jgi:tetratricopeptide (TPR) repeat protein
MIKPVIQEEKMKNVLGVLFVVWMIIPMWAQAPGTTPPAPGPELTVNGESPMVLSRLAVDVAINGFIAETKMTMTFFNPHNRVLEGDLNFPLPEGSFVSGYALDINGVMVDGVIVEKEKGRVVFEKIVRQGIDPGLVEWVEGNNFKTRIFPIPAKGSRTVAVKYLSEILYKNQDAYFYLPLHFKNKINEFSLRLEVLGTAQKPEVKQGSPANFQFQRWSSGFKAEAALKDFLPAGDLIIALPGSPLQTVRVEQSPDDNYYFSILDWIEKNKTLEDAKPKKPRYITILWDASASMGKSNHQQELELLKAYFLSLNTKEIPVDLIFFHSQREKPRHFQVRKNNIDTLIRAIAETRYDGGTSLAALTAPGDEPVPDFYLLFSDGRNNFGKDESPVFKAPVYAFSGSALANHAFLRSAAQQSGGMYFNLNQPDRDTVLKQIGRSPYSFISVTVQEGVIVGTFPHDPQPVSGRFSLAGILTTPQARLTLNYGRSGKILKRESFTVSAAEAEKGKRLQTFWAQKKIAELQRFPDRNRQELVDTGEKYGLVTPGTSLIVLDNLEQYWQHKIIPPESLPQMREEYFRRLERQQKDTEAAAGEKIEHLVRLWNQRVKWWETSYPLQPPKPKKEANTTPVSSPPAAASVRSQPAAAPQPVNIRPLRSNRIRYIMEHSRQYIAGQVVLEDGSEIPGVLINLTRSDSNFTRTTVTNENGHYIFADIPDGRYKIKAELEGFKTVVRPGLRLRQGNKLEIMILMETATIKEEITILGAAPTVDVHSSAVSTEVLEESDVEESERVWNNDGANISDPSAVGAAPAYLNAQSDDGKSPTGPAIALKEWNPQTPYLEGLKQAGPGEAYEAYLKQKQLYGNAPSYYLDCADYFFKAGLKESGLRVISNLAEMEMENPALLRVLGYRLAQLDYLDLSTVILEKVLQLRPEEPQSYRDLALVLERLDRFDRAVDLLYRVVIGQWDQRFAEIETIALMELNNTLRKASAAGVKGLQEKIDPRLCKVLDVDVRIVLTWDADMTDMDLWVTDPRGEKSYYGHRLSYLGGAMSCDYTQGYGPEEYLLKKAPKGEFKIQVNYYSSRAFKLLGPITLQVDIFTDYGRKSEKKKSITVRLTQRQEIIDVGSIQI